MAKYTDNLSLVRFRGEYFPFSETDFRLLRERNVSVFRISESTLDILSRTLLKGVKIEQHPWSKVYSDIISSFQASLLEASAEGVFQFKQEKNWMTIMVDTSDEETKESNLSACNRHVNQLTEYVGRYGIRAVQQEKDREGYRLVRITFNPDENIIPSFFFGCREDHNAPLFLELNLSSAARLKFQKRLNLNGEPTFAVAFEDRFGDHYAEAFTRGFPFSSLKPKDCEAAIEFFVNLHSRLTIKKKG